MCSDHLSPIGNICPHHTPSLLLHPTDVLQTDTPPPCLLSTSSSAMAPPNSPHPHHPQPPTPGGTVPLPALPFSAEPPLSSLLSARFRSAPGQILPRDFRGDVRSRGRSSVWRHCVRGRGMKPMCGHVMCGQDWHFVYRP